MKVLQILNSLYSHVTPENLHGNSQQYHPKKLADYKNAVWPQQAFQQVDGAKGKKDEDQVNEDGQQDIIGCIFCL